MSFWRIFLKEVVQSRGLCCSAMQLQLSTHHVQPKLLDAGRTICRPAGSRAARFLSIAAAAVADDAANGTPKRGRQHRPASEPIRRATRRTWSDRIPSHPQMPGGTTATASAVSGMQPAMGAVPSPAMRVHEPRIAAASTTHLAPFDRSSLSAVTLALPGVAPGAPAASAQALLQAVKAIPQKDLPTVIRDVQALVNHDTVSGPQRQFLVDTETTAFSDTYDKVQQCHVSFRVVEVCCLDLHTGDKFHTLVDNGGPIGTNAMKTHGLTPAKLKGSPSTVVAATALLLWLWQRCATTEGGMSQVVLVAHNAPFDLRAFAASWAEAGLFYPAPAARTSGWMSFCSMNCAKALFPDSKSSLDAVAAAMNVPASDRHRADADVQVLHGVLTAWARKFSPGSTLQDAISDGFGVASPSTHNVKAALAKVTARQ